MLQIVKPDIFCIFQVNDISEVFYMTAYRQTFDTSFLFFFRGPNGTNNGHLPKEISQSERDLTKVTKVRVRTTANLGSPHGPSPLTKDQFKPRTKMKTTTMIVTSPEDQIGPKMGQNVVKAPLNWQLVDTTIGQLQKASDDLVQLYKRISLDYEMEDGERAKMLQKLAMTAGAVSQQTLKPVNPHETKNPYVQQSMQNQGPSWC